MAQTKRRKRLDATRKLVRSSPPLDPAARAKLERRLLLDGRRRQREIVRLVGDLERAIRRADYKLLAFATVIGARAVAAKRLDAEIATAEREARDARVAAAGGA